MSNPTPADMPGAITTQEPPPDSIEPTDAPPETGDANGGEIDLDKVVHALGGPEGLKAILQGERRWEKQARKNVEKAQKWDANADKVAKWDEEQAKNQTVAERLQAERDAALERATAAETAKLRSDIAGELRVPTRAVIGSDEASMREAAQEYKDALQAGIDAELKAKGVSPAAPASSVTSDGKPDEGTKQLTRADLQTMSPAQVQAAYKAGQLDNLRGINK